MPERIHVVFDEELRRRRPAVLFRVPLALLPLAAVAVWTLALLFALPLAWLGALLRGGAPRWWHRFVRAYLHTLLRAHAWTLLVSGRYPALRRRHEHPVRVVAPRVRQPRLVTLIRILLAVPGLVVGSVLAVVLLGSAIAAWFVALVLGRTTPGLRELGAFCLRYEAELLAYVLILSPHRPRIEPPVS